MERGKSILGKDEHDFQQFESKIDEVNEGFNYSR